MPVLDITTDPRSTLPDHYMWDKLLKQSSQYGGEILNRALYMIRSAGAKLEDVGHGKLKILPMFQPEGHWTSESEWQEWAIPTLKRFAVELKQALEAAREG